MGSIDGATLFVSILTSTTVGSIVMYFLNRKLNNSKVAAVGADTYQTWIDSNSKLADELEEARELARKDRKQLQTELGEVKDKFEKELKDLRALYEKKIAALNKRMSGLEGENARLILENHDLRRGGDKGE